MILLVYKGFEEDFLSKRQATCRYEYYGSFECSEV